jgi:hypothetical protein
MAAQDGIIIDGAGIIVAVVHGYVGTPEGGHTFRACDTSNLKAGSTAPAAVEALIAPTDASMARVTEDLLVSLITKGTLAKADLPAAAIQHINLRRSIRGLPAL